MLFLRVSHTLMMTVHATYVTTPMDTALIMETLVSDPIIME